jgi:hypothetical protein
MSQEDEHHNRHNRRPYEGAREKLQGGILDAIILRLRNWFGFNRAKVEAIEGLRGSLEAMARLRQAKLELAIEQYREERTPELIARAYEVERRAHEQTLLDFDEAKAQTEFRIALMRHVAQKLQQLPERPVAQSLQEARELRQLLEKFEE